MSIRRFATLLAVLTILGAILFFFVGIWSQPKVAITVQVTPPASDVAVLIDNQQLGKTDNEGTLRLESREWQVGQRVRVALKLDGYRFDIADEMLFLKEHGNIVEGKVFLFPSPSLTVRALDQSLNGVGNCEVRLFGENAGARYLESHGLTNTNGIAILNLQDVPPGQGFELVLRDVAPGWVLDGESTTSIVFQVGQSTQAYAFQLRDTTDRRPFVKIMITDSDGAPLRDANIVHSGSTIASTNSNGLAASVRFETPDMEYKVIVKKRYYSNDTLSVRPSTHAQPEYQATLEPLKFDLQLIASTNAQKERVQDVYIYVKQNDEGSLLGVTNSEGKLDNIPCPALGTEFEFYLTKGDFWKFEPLVISGVPANGQVFEAKPPATGCSIHLSVTTQSNEPLTNAEVTISGSGVLNSGKTNIDGRVTLRHENIRTGGSYSLRIRPTSAAETTREITVHSCSDNQSIQVALRSILVVDATQAGMSIAIKNPQGSTVNTGIAPFMCELDYGVYTFSASTNDGIISQSENVSSDTVRVFIDTEDPWLKYQRLRSAGKSTQDELLALVQKAEKCAHRDHNLLATRELANLFYERRAYSVAYSKYKNLFSASIEYERDHRCLCNAASSAYQFSAENVNSSERLSMLTDAARWIDIALTRLGSIPDQDKAEWHCIMMYHKARIFMEWRSYYLSPATYDEERAGSLATQARDTWEGDFLDNLECCSHVSQATCDAARTFLTNLHQ